MRIVATSDTHYPPFVKRQDTLLHDVYEPTIAIPDGDVFIHAGDIMRMGYENEWEGVLEWLARLPHKHKYYIPGNHDFHLSLYPGPALQQLRSIGVVCVGLPGNNHYCSVTLPNGMSLLGLPYVVDMPRWANSMENEAELEYHLQIVWPQHHDIVVSHSPVFGCLDHGKGIKVYRKYLLNQPPRIWISGHIHEGYGHMHVNGCDLYNVAMCDRAYKHANSPMVIDI